MQITKGVPDKLKEAKVLLDRLVTTAHFADFLTLSAYDDLN